MVHLTITLLDPPTSEVGPINSPLCVRPCVCSGFFSKTSHGIFLKLGMKLELNIRKNVTEPDFLQKSGFWVNEAKVLKFGENCGFLGFSRKPVMRSF